MPFLIEIRWDDEIALDNLMQMELILEISLLIIQGLDIKLTLFLYHFFVDTEKAYFVFVLDNYICLLSLYMLKWPGSQYICI